MFTGFATENTPAIQVWDFFRAFASTSAIRHVGLADDCAPIQVFRTGATATAIRVTLPSCPVEGKMIKIVNVAQGQLSQSVNILASDSDAGTSAIYSIGQGASLDLVYSKNVISKGGINFNSGWLSLNLAPTTAANYFGFAAGDGASANGIQSAALGSGASATGNFSTAIGTSATASGTSSVAISGGATTASGNSSFVAGGGGGIARSLTGNTIFAASSNPITTTSGASQAGLLVLGTQTTDATATVLRSNTSAASTTNQLILPNNSAYVFQGTVIANVTGGGNTSGWRFEGTIKRGANAASTTLVAAVTPTVISQDAGASAWVVAVTADTTNGGLAVTVTGAAATTIRWVCRLESTEVTF